MQPLLDVAAELLDAAQKSDKKGLYFYAGLKYAQVWATLANVVILRDAGTVPLTPTEEGRLAMLYQLLATRLQQLQAKMRNGKRLSGNSSDSPAEAIDALLEEVLQGF
jgi:hypothetical protein